MKVTRRRGSGRNAADASAPALPSAAGGEESTAVQCGLTGPPPKPPLDM